MDLFPAHRGAFNLLEGTPESAWPSFERGGLLISEPQMLSDHLRVASLNMMTLYKMNQFSIFKKRNRR